MTVRRGRARVLREAWDGFGELGEHGFRSTIGGCLGEMLARLGRLDEAEAMLDEAIAISTPDDWVTVAQVQNGSRVRRLGARRPRPRACELARKASSSSTPTSTSPSAGRCGHLSSGEILLAAGRLEEARTALVSAREVAERKGSTVVVARADELLAGLGA